MIMNNDVCRHSPLSGMVPIHQHLHYHSIPTTSFKLSVMSNSNTNDFDSTSANSGQSNMEFHPFSMAYETEPLPDNADAAATAAVAASFSTPTSTRALRGDASIDNNTISSSSATTAINPRRTSMPEMMEQSHRRASIQRIMRDAELSQLEKQRSIQFLMDGRKLLQRRATVECGSTFGSGSTATSSVMGSNRSSFTLPAAAATAAAAAPRDRRNAMGGESEEDDAGSGMEDDDDDCDDNTKLRRRRRSSSYENGKSDVPDYDAITAAAIAHAKSQTASDLFASQHPYKATTTVVPAIAAQASASALLESRQQQLHQHPHQQAPHHGSSIDCARSAVEMAPKCTHYQRNCHIVSPCCGAIFACRICHDDFPVLPPPLLLSSAGGCNHTNNSSQQHQRMLRTSSMPVSFANSAEEHHTLPRYAIKEIICRKCFTKQSSKTNFCINCNVQFGEYHCAICNLWMSNEERPYHCPDCGFCRVGGLENFRHCLDCGMCIDRQLFNDHNCMAGKYMSDCPVCQEDLFSSRAASHELPCGHAIHWHCFQQLANHDSRCPICKKTAETQERMKPTWDAIAMGIASQPVPPELCKVVSIICNDCEAAQTNRAWHFWGVQCRACDSFNTVVDRIIMMGEEAHEFLQREMQHPLPGSSIGAGIGGAGIDGSGGFGESSVGASSPTVAGPRTSSSPCPRPRTRRRATIQEPPPPPPFM